MRKRNNSGRFEKGFVFGFGVFDSNKTVKEEGVAYTIWKSMISRCYNKKYQLKQKTYVNCIVSDEWRYFSVFKLWFSKNYVEGWELDKDLLGDGKIYSEETCCFLPKKINLCLPKLNTVSKTFSGVMLRNYGKYTSQITNEYGKMIHLGTFDCEEDAYNAYKSEKERILKTLAELYKSEMREDCYRKLISLNLTEYLHKINPCLIN